MGKINVLSFEIANLIAAGEVVERPASVLKELIENSIDSGATVITAEIKRGGVSLIRVTDNGCGMSREDLPVALKRHATSKIQDKDDLAAIMTLGFRGEALAAISSVSKVTIITKTRDAETGSMLVSEGGTVEDVSEVYSADGTTVVVSDLFYNVPARRKFLKKDATEALNVAALVERVALSRPDISIQLLIDGEERFKTPGDGDLMNTIYAVLGREFSSKLIPVSGEAGQIRVHGYIGRSDNTRRNRNLLNVFINGRYVKSLTVQAAIEKAYTSYIAPEAFPTCVLFVDVNPSAVDVNVHPAKLEVKFSDERSIFEIVYYSVKNALEDHEYRPELELGSHKREKNYVGAYVPIGADTRGEQISISTPAGGNTTPRGAGTGGFGAGAAVSDRVITSSVGFRDSSRGAECRSAGAAHTVYDSHRAPAGQGGGRSYTDVRGSEGATMTPRDSVELLERYKRSEASSVTEGIPSQSEMPVSAVADSEAVPEFRIIGEAFDCYIFVEYEGELLVIDKHAAHERVIFEDLKRSREADGRVATQMLMLPITVIPTPEELSAAREHKDELFSVGFEYTLGDRSVDLTGIPDAISSADAEGLLITMLSELADSSGNPETTEKIRRERALYQIACKAAIKGGRRYDENIIKWLVSKLLSMPDVVVCPHGRPVAFRLTKGELDRRFDRIK